MKRSAPQPAHRSHMRIGLTGATGVLGRRIRASLSRRGHEVRAFEGADVRDLDALERWAMGLDLVVHAAARVPVTEVSERPGDAIAINVGGSANIARTVKRLAGCRLAYISTSHVYRSATTPLSETYPLEPITDYGLTKLQGEQWIQRLVPDALIVRVFSFFDVHQQPPYFLPSLLERIVAAPMGTELPLRGSTNIRDLADAEFMGDTCARLVELPESGVVNCGCGHGFSILDVASALCRALGREDIIWRVEPDAQPSVLVADTAELNRRLGSPPSFDLADAVNRFAAARLASQAVTL